MSPALPATRVPFGAAEYAKSDGSLLGWKSPVNPSEFSLLPESEGNHGENVSQQVSAGCLTPPGTLYDKMDASCQGGMVPGESMAILCQRKEGTLSLSAPKWEESEVLISPPF